MPASHVMVTEELVAYIIINLINHILLYFDKDYRIMINISK